jgi:hypothetical protein
VKVPLLPIVRRRDLIDEPDVPHVFPLGPDVEQPLRLPHQRRRGRAAHRAVPRGRIELVGELGQGHPQVEPE